MIIWISDGISPILEPGPWAESFSPVSGLDIFPEANFYNICLGDLQQDGRREEAFCRVPGLGFTCSDSEDKWF